MTLQEMRTKGYPIADKVELLLICRGCGKEFIHLFPCFYDDLDIKCDNCGRHTIIHDLLGDFPTMDVMT